MVFIVKLRSASMNFFRIWFAIGSYYFFLCRKWLPIRSNNFQIFPKMDGYKVSRGFCVSPYNQPPCIAFFCTNVLYQPHLSWVISVPIGAQTLSYLPLDLLSLYRLIFINIFLNWCLKFSFKNDSDAISDSFNPLIESNTRQESVLCQNLMRIMTILRSVYYSQDFTDICLLYDVLLFCFFFKS